MAGIDSAVKEWEAAVGSVAGILRSVSSQVEAQFALTYDGSSGAGSEDLNPARLAARFVALQEAVPDAIADVVALSREDFEASRELHDAAVAAAEKASLLAAVVLGEHAAQDDPNATTPETSFQAELTALCEQVSESSRAAQRDYALLISAESHEGLLSNDDLDQEYQKCLSLKALAADSHLTAEPLVAAPKGKSEKSIQCKVDDEVVRPRGRSKYTGGVEKKHAQKATVGEKENLTPAGHSAGPWLVETASNPAPKSMSRENSDGFKPIAKPEYQRLAPMLKRQAKLNDLNLVYEKAYLLLSARGAPMPENELLDACGEESSKKLDVLRRGFAVLKFGPQGWSLGKAAPPQTVSRSRPPLGPGASASNRMASD